MEKLGDESVGQEVSPSTVALVSSIGATVWWYDFFIFVTAAGLVFNYLVFRNPDPIAGTLVAYLTFAVGFAAWSVDGNIFGHYGERIGQNIMLILSLDTAQ